MITENKVKSTRENTPNTNRLAKTMLFFKLTRTKGILFIKMNYSSINNNSNIFVIVNYQHTSTIWNSFDPIIKST